MKKDSTKFSTVDEYLAAQPEIARERLVQIRGAIMKAAPKAEEVISYNMPAAKQNGILLYYAGFKNHVGVYPRWPAFKKELAAYNGAKGSVQFPLDKPLPLALIGKMVKYKVAENMKKVEVKKKGKA